MKKFTNLLIVSILGGVITLGSYLLFFQKESQIITIKNPETPSIFKTSTPNSFIPKGEIDFTKAAKETVDAVVHVKNTSVKTVRDPFAEMFYGNNAGSRKYAQVGTGSGVIISSDGYIVTNNHVINGATEIEITLNNKKTYTAQLIGSDVNSDIALVKIEASELPFVTFANSDSIQIGEWVLAVGNPYNLTSTVTAGIVSAKGRDLEGNNVHESFIQTDAAVNPGNSGGALVNTRGELVGINTAISSKTGSFIGYSFAVPSNIAKKVIEDLLEFGNVQQAILGVNGNELNGNFSKELDLQSSEGFYVTKVTKNSGADSAGIMAKDIITKLDDVKITSYADLTGYIGSKQPGDNVNVVVLRNGVEIKTIVTLTKKEMNKFILGFNLEDLSYNELQNKNIKNGVFISEIENKELLKFGVKAGFIITTINGVAVKSADEVKKIIGANLGKNIIRIEMINLKGERERYIFQ
ncbi:MAG: trypsin-like peptidase domain-containing protein [Flavobacteriaceae bacterium]